MVAARDYNGAVVFCLLSVLLLRWIWQGDIYNPSDGTGIMPANFIIRELHEMADLLKTVELQQAIWGMQAYECASPYTLNAAVHTGGSVIAAELEGRMVGFCFAFAAKRADALWLWSHMAGVHPDFQGQGIGFKLKQAQREWALGQGYRVIAWTFDPMQGGNANFNFNRLGVKAHRYYVDHYGLMQDGINAGLASDRLEAVWHLDAPQVIDMAQGRIEAYVRVGQLEDVKLVYVDDSGRLRQRELPAYDQECYCIEVPLHLAALKQADIEQARVWQLYLRSAMTALLAAGYKVYHFVRERRRGWYVLCRDAS